jgi:hypothetical protein
MKQRIFSNYYRVAFYGKKFEDMDQKAYIYKEHVTMMLPDFTAKLLVYSSILRNMIWFNLLLSII